MNDKDYHLRQLCLLRNCILQIDKIRLRENLFRNKKGHLLILGHYIHKTPSHPNILVLRAIGYFSSWYKTKMHNSQFFPNYQEEI